MSHDGASELGRLQSVCRTGQNRGGIPIFTVVTEAEADRRQIVSLPVVDSSSTRHTTPNTLAFIDPV